MGDRDYVKPIRQANVIKERDKRNKSDKRKAY